MSLQDLANILHKKIKNKPYTPRSARLWRIALPGSWTTRSAHPNPAMILLCAGASRSVTFDVVSEPDSSTFEHARAENGSRKFLPPENCTTHGETAC